MPPKKTYRRRRRRRRRKNNYNQVVIGRAPVPRSTMVKFKYCDNASLDTVAGGPAVHLWSANSLYDPNTTATGHQPLGFDQWTTFYDHYTVVGAKIIAQFTPNPLDLGANLMCGIYVDDNSVPATQYHGIQEQSECNWKIMSGSTGPVTLTKKLSIKKFFNKSSLKDEKELQGQMGNFGTGTSPSEQAYFGTWFIADTTTIDPSPVQVHVTIEYYAILHEPKELNQS